MSVYFTAAAAQANRNMAFANMLGNYVNATTQSRISFSFVDSEEEDNPLLQTWQWK
jgi:hypothetical protein